MKRKRMLITFIAVGILSFSNTCLAAEKAALVHNTHQEIVSKENTLQLKLIRIWGGEDEEDEKKFFVYPFNIAIDSRGLVYICDQFNFCVKLFDDAGKYLQTIGRKGRGPGDLIGPGSIGFSTSGDIWVMEMGNRRFQCFDISGKSKSIFKHKHIPIWMSVTGKNEIAVYSPFKTLKTRKLISFYNEKGKCLREIGTYHDPSKTAIGCEWLVFARDRHDNFFAGNKKTPVVRKYTADGAMVLAFTFETPAQKRPEIGLNEKGNEIVRFDHLKNRTRLLRKGNDLIIKTDKTKNYHACMAIGTDSLDNIYVVTVRRHLSEKEGDGSIIMASGDYQFIDRSKVNFDVWENIDYLRMIVFNPGGKVIAGAILNTFCHDIYIKGNRIFIIDGEYTQRILEYEMIFKE